VICVDLDPSKEQAKAHDWPPDYTAVQTSPDGSCFFAALADLLGLPMTHAYDLRLHLVQHIRHHRDRLMVHDTLIIDHLIGI